jgi:RNA polymerase sigma-70 factor (ECF subfamily)
MRRLGRGDDDALALLVRRHSGRMLGVASRLLGSAADAEDAVQRAFIRCHAYARAYREEWSVTTWLYRILTNICVDEIRRRRSRSETHGLAVADDGTAGSRAGNGHAVRAGHAAAPGHGDRVEARLDVQRALAQVPNEARTLLVLRYVEGLSYGELARVRGITVNTVKSQLKRGKTILKAALSNGRPGRPRTKRAHTRRREIQT